MALPLHHNLFNLLITAVFFRQAGCAQKGQATPLGGRPMVESDPGPGSKTDQFAMSIMVMNHLQYIW
jgi:hypothetical protein